MLVGYFLLKIADFLKALSTLLLVPQMLQCTPLDTETAMNTLPKFLPSRRLQWSGQRRQRPVQYHEANASAQGKARGAYSETTQLILGLGPS